MNFWSCLSLGKEMSGTSKEQLVLNLQKGWNSFCTISMTLAGRIRKKRKEEKG